MDKHTLAEILDEIREKIENDTEAGCFFADCDCTDHIIAILPSPN